MSEREKATFVSEEIDKSIRKSLAQWEDKLGSGDYQKAEVILYYLFRHLYQGLKEMKKGTKSIEEKAKEYVDNLLDGKLNDTPLLYKAVFDNYINIFQVGYNSRDEEVNQLETNLRKFIDMCSSPCVIDEERFNDELNDLIIRSKLLLKGGKDD